MQRLAFACAVTLAAVVLAAVNVEADWEKHVPVVVDPGGFDARTLPLITDYPWDRFESGEVIVLVDKEEMLRALKAADPLGTAPNGRLEGVVVIDGQAYSIHGWPNADGTIGRILLNRLVHRVTQR